jgi:hypothetical protein
MDGRGGGIKRMSAKEPREEGGIAPTNSHYWGYFYDRQTSERRMGMPAEGKLVAAPV